MLKKCPSCGFKNPADLDECLSCGVRLPETRAEFRESMESLADLARGDFGKVGEKIARDTVTEKVSAVKYKLHPVWFLKVKLHRLKESAKACFWIFVIIIGIVVFGIIYNFIRRLLGGS